ncbi:molybdopterin-guanine dinucleotide biosynthesis protein MobB [Vallitalea longa]|uniref:Molybdopterin-guanine dinucleotide biosynthesis protein MobB n=1 Tax=Vallitalea longa TaxID=2936439 RepID=A0A9W5YBM1_9FIRM|nr:molybdopterin-guanine dinucleotide biosynthesis protein B [Vallitalea longa]GKX31012.1 molybdopterin-guanine dinucleotide biosynthesis protein MobB [Vallitalea longa]
MKIFSVYGYTDSGKTTTIENIIKELRKRRFTVGSVKEIHYEEFEIDKEGTNTSRHKEAGSQLVTARGYHETDILYQKKLSVEEILSFYNHDYVILEGVTDYNMPKILTAKSIAEIRERIDDSVFVISGRVAEQISEYEGIPVINCMKNIDELTNLLINKVYDKLPDFSKNCCSECGYDCRTLGNKILRGEAKREDCSIKNTYTKLYIDDREIDMVPFVSKILNNAVLGVIKELDGYKKGSTIRIETKS